MTKYAGDTDFLSLTRPTYLYKVSTRVYHAMPCRVVFLPNENLEKSKQGKQERSDEAVLYCTVLHSRVGSKRALEGMRCLPCMNDFSGSFRSECTYACMHVMLRLWLVGWSVSY